MSGSIYTEDKLEYIFYPVKSFKTTLQVQAGHDAHVCLSSTDSNEATPIIEIFLAGWNNQESAIRLNREKPDKAHIETPDLLSGDEFKSFVVEWNTEGRVWVSLDGASEPFMDWTNEEPFVITHLGIRSAWGSVADWKLDGTKEVHTEDSMDYTFFPVSCGSLDFEVKANSNAHLCLTSGPNDEPPMYEIFLGGWDNTKCVIRLNKEKPDVAECGEASIINGEAYSKFWLKWNYSGVFVGREGETEPFLSWNNPEIVPVSFFGIRTGWGSSGYWRISGVEGSVEETPVEEKSENEVESSSEAPAKVEVPTVEGVSWVAASNGEVPEGALVGGNDNGEDMFVVRAVHLDAILPGKLLKSHAVAYVPWGGEEHSKESYEVLVVPAENVTWQATSGETIPSNAIPAGKTLEDEILYVGRAEHEGALTVGKVHPSHAVMYISYGGAEVSVSEYEILLKN